MKKLYSLTTIALSFFTCSTFSMAEPFLDKDASEQIRQQERNKAEQERILSDTKKDIFLKDESAKGSEIILDEANCFKINEIEFKDLEKRQDGQLKNSEAKSSFNFLLNQTLKSKKIQAPICLGGKGLQSIVKTLQNKLIDKGYTTTRVLVGPQNLKTGKLILTIVPGYIEKIKVQDLSSSPRFTRASKFFGLNTSEDDIFNLRDIETSLENLKRIPTADADIEIKPSENENAKPGASDLLIKYKQVFPVRLNLNFDDSGTKTTGKYQLATTLSVDNPFTFNDLFYVSFTNSIPYHKARVGSKGNRNLSFYYSIPLKFSTFSISTSNYYYHQTVPGYNKNYKYAGKSNNLNLDLDTTIYRSSSSKTSLITGLWGRASRNFIDDAEIEVQEKRLGGFHIGINHREYIGNAVLNLGLDYKQGTGFYKSKRAPEELSGDGTSRPKIITASINFSKPFKIATQNFMFNTNFKHQWDHTPLLTQDRFSIGSRYTVRGFDGELSLLGERGYYIRNQLDWNYHKDHSLYVGLDYGRVGGPSTQYQLGNKLMGAAIGVKGNLFKYLSYDLFASKPIKKPSGFKTSKYNLGFNLSVSF